MSTQVLEVENFERRDHPLADPQKGQKLTWSISVVPVWFRLNLVNLPSTAMPKVSAGVPWLAGKLHPVNLRWAENITSCKHAGCPLGRRRAKQQHHGVPLAPAWQLRLLLSSSLEDYPTTGPQPRRHMQFIISSPVSAECRLLSHHVETEKSQGENRLTHPPWSREWIKWRLRVTQTAFLK